MATVENDCYFHCSPYAQQKYSHISCFWEKQPSGCVKISCAFHHSKPRNINGLFLPPSNNVPLQQGGQEKILHAAHHQESLQTQENIFLPVHAPLIINLNNDEDEEDDEDDDEKENYVSNGVPKTAAEIEEERAIKEICYKSGEYYRIQYPHEHQSAETVSSPQEKEILLLEAMEQDLQKGDGNTIPTFNNTKREGESWRRRIPTERISRKDHQSFENGETNHSELVNKHHFKEIKKNKWISEEPRNSPNTVPGKGFHTSQPKGKPSYQPRSQSKDDETASSVSCGREAGRKTYCDSSEPRRSVYVFYRTVDVTQEPKFNGSTGSCEVICAQIWARVNLTQHNFLDGNIPATLNNTKREGDSSGRRVPTERIPRRNCPSFENGGIHTSDPNVKPNYQQRRKNKDDETASSVPYVRAAGRKTDFGSSEPRRSAYVFYRTVNVTQEPKFNGSTAVPEPYGRKCSKPKNQFDTNRRFLTQTEHYDKYTSGSYNAPRWRKRNPHENTYSKSKTTIRRSQEDVEVNNKGE